METIIVSGDKDLMQLITPKVSMYDPMKDKTFQIPEVVERFGVPPEKVTEVMGLCGDTSDNIPGVPGIGEKTAARLIQEFGSIEELLKNVEKVKQPKLRENLTHFADQARVSRELATLDTQGPGSLGPGRNEGREIRTPRSCTKFSRRWNFPSSSRNLPPEPERREDDYRLVLEKETFDRTRWRI